jgi:hypothetical protein
VILADPVLLDVVGEVAFLKKKKKEKKNTHPSYLLHRNTHSLFPL